MSELHGKDLQQIGRSRNIVAMVDRLPEHYRGLSDMERNFVSAYCDGASVKGAQVRGGYAQTTDSYHLIRKPHIAAAIRAEILRRLATEGATVGFRALTRIAQDTKAPAAAQVAAAKALLQGAGLLDNPESPVDSKPLTEYTREELRDYIEKRKEDIARIEAEIADRARIIEPAQGGEPIDPFE